VKNKNKNMKIEKCTTYMQQRKMCKGRERL